MSFHYTAAKSELESARKYDSEGVACIEKEDFAGVRFCAYHTFFYSMRAMLLGDGEDVGSHSETAVRFKQRYMDTGRFPDAAYPSIQLALALHNREAYEDVDLCGDDEAVRLLREAEKFCRYISDRVERIHGTTGNEWVMNEYSRVLKMLALAEEFEAAYNAEDDGRFPVQSNDLDLLGLVKDNLQRMFYWGWDIDGLTETYAACCLRLIKMAKAQGAPADAEMRELLGVCRELGRSDPDKWARDTADLCEALADGSSGREAEDLYREALGLYRSLYEMTGASWDRFCIENLEFKLDIDSDGDA